MDDLYREDLMEHYKYPQNRGSMPTPDVEVVEKNPMCGDLITMQAKIKDNRVEDIKFDGDACVVCVAASSILTDSVRLKDLNEAIKYSKEDLLKDIGVNITTSRIKCATLPLEAFNHLVEKYNAERK